MDLYWLRCGSRDRFDSVVQYSDKSVTTAEQSKKHGAQSETRLGAESVHVHTETQTLIKRRRPLEKHQREEDLSAGLRKDGKDERSDGFYTRSSVDQKLIQSCEVL